MTDIEQAVINVVEMRVSENSEWLKTIDDYRDKLRLGFFKKEYMNSLFQVDSRFNIEFHHAYSFAQVHWMITTGKVAHAKVYIGMPPVSDSLTEEMNKRLSLLDKPFSAYFHGGTQGRDGFLKVSEKIDLCLTNEESGKVEKEKLRFIDWQIPLEVGTTSICKTHYYLVGNQKCLARWPYGSEWIYLWQTSKEYSDQLDREFDERLDPQIKINDFGSYQLSLSL